MSRAAGAAGGTLTGHDAGDALLARPLVPALLVLAALAACLVALFTALRDHGYPGEALPSQGVAVVSAGPPGSDYASQPPTSGPRVDRLPSSFVLASPLEPAEQVNLLAYGNVLLQYNDRCPEGASCPPDRARLGAELAAVARLYNNSPVGLSLRRGHGVVVAPNYELRPGNVALTAWTRLERLERFDRGTIERFIGAWLGDRARAGK